MQTLQGEVLGRPLLPERFCKHARRGRGWDGKKKKDRRVFFQRESDCLECDLNFRFRGGSPEHCFETVAHKVPEWRDFDTEREALLDRVARKLKPMARLTLFSAEAKRAFDQARAKDGLFFRATRNAERESFHELEEVWDVWISAMPDARLVDLCNVATVERMYMRLRSPIDAAETLGDMRVRDCMHRQFDLSSSQPPTPLECGIAYGFPLDTSIILDCD